MGASNRENSMTTSFSRRKREEPEMSGVVSAYRDKLDVRREID